MAKSTREKKPGRPIGKTALYNYASKHAKDAIDVLVKTMMNKREQGSVRVGAAKALLNKCIPDLKATEYSDAEGNKLIPIAIFGGKTADAIPTDDSN